MKEAPETEQTDSTSPEQVTTYNNKLNILSIPVLTYSSGGTLPTAPSQD